MKLPSDAHVVVCSSRRVSGKDRARRLGVLGLWPAVGHGGSRWALIFLPTRCRIRLQDLTIFLQLSGNDFKCRKLIQIVLVSRESYSSKSCVASRLCAKLFSQRTHLRRCWLSDSSRRILRSSWQPPSLQASGRRLSAGQPRACLSVPFSYCPLRGATPASHSCSSIPNS